MKSFLPIVFLLAFSMLVQSDENVQVTVNQDCDYYGNDFLDENGEAIKITDVDAEKCKTECIKKAQCTHYTSSEFGCFLKHADAKEAALNSTQEYPSSICGMIESRFTSKQ